MAKGRLTPKGARRTAGNADQPEPMGVFHVDCSVQDVAGAGDAVTVTGLLVDTGSEYTWLPRQALREAGLTVRKRDVPFVMANGQIITREVGYAILRCQGFETVDEVVFAEDEDLRLLGSRALEGFGAVLDARQKKLAPAGPYPAAAVINCAVRATTTHIWSLPVRTQAQAQLLAAETPKSP